VLRAIGLQQDFGAIRHPYLPGLVGLHPLGCGAPILVRYGRSIDGIVGCVPPS
jgi:hypothetical protein